MTDWYIPSFYGDIKLKPDGENGTIILMDNATSQEIDAVKKYRDAALKPRLFRSAIATPNDFGDPSPVIAAGKTFMARVNSDPQTVSGQLARLLKPGRLLLTAARFYKGSLEEVWRSPDAPTDEPELKALPKPPPDPPPYRKPDPEEKEKEKPKDAVVVAAPQRGCPAPAFDPAEMKARRVLSKFVTDEQMEDFLSHGRFVSVGADTGKRYMITSREAPAIQKYGRSLFGLDDGIPFCTHDWDVPAAEEVLALHLFVSLSGWESWITGVRE